MDTMSAQDATFLYIENEVNHMHVAVVAIFEGPAPQGREIEEMVSSKLDHVPRYRQKVRFVPFDIGRPVWSDDHHFNLGYHVRHTALPAPGSDEQLRTLVGRVMSQKLDREKPLWEIWVAEGLEGDRWAILSKVHHCMVDGVSGTDLLSMVLDDVPDAAHPPGAAWEPEPRPSGRSLLRESITDGLRKPREGFQALRRVLEAPVRAMQELGDLTDSLATFRTFADAELETSLNGPIGPHRRWCHASTSIENLGKIKGAHGGTLNDIVLAVIARGFRDLLLSRGEPVEGLSVRTLVPVSVRREDERGTLNNRVAAIFADLPMGVVDPVKRLALVRTEMERLKEHHQADASKTFTSLTDLAPPALLAFGARVFSSLEQHTVQTVTTNVPGPRSQLYAANRRMVAAYPYVPLAGSVRIGVAIFSYAGQVTFGITGDYETAPDIECLAAGIDAGIAELIKSS